MRTANKNKVKMWYSLKEENIPVYERDRYGNIVYTILKDGTKIPVPTGEYISGYRSVHEFLGNIALSGGEAEAREYGVDVSAYDATLLTNKGYLPIDETSRIWTKKPDLDESGFYDADKADYKVVKVNPSLNQDRFLLGKVVK